MNTLPREIINKIMLFISHPVADIFKIELEFAYDKMKADGELDKRCDCCVKLWTECYCVCSNCHGHYSDCRYGCYDVLSLNV